METERALRAGTTKIRVCKVILGVGHFTKPGFFGILEGIWILLNIQSKISKGLWSCKVGAVGEAPELSQRACLVPSWQTWLPFYWLTTGIVVPAFQGVNAFLGLMSGWRDLFRVYSYCIYQVSHKAYHMDSLHTRPMKWPFLPRPLLTQIYCEWNADFQK